MNRRRASIRCVRPPARRGEERSSRPFPSRSLRTAGGKVVPLEGAAPPKRVGITEWDSLEQAEAFTNRLLKPWRKKSTPTPCCNCCIYCIWWNYSLKIEAYLFLTMKYGRCV